MEKTDNYSGYTQVLENKVPSSMKIMRNHIISYRVIRYKLEPGRSILEEYE